MEKCVGIVCEFNPFHKGHAYLIERVRFQFPEKGIVCIMSGNFVQRGSLAIQEKYSRAACAVSAGVDLVLELPAPFSCLSAEGFAQSAIHILLQSGLCDTLAFGCENDDEARLCLVADRIASEQFQSRLNDFLSSHRGIGYPAAREEVYKELYEVEPLLSLPNASLALEYLQALKKHGAKLGLYPVLRKGADFHSFEEKDGLASATALRKRIKDEEGFSNLVTPFAFDEMKKEKTAGRFPVFDEALSPIIFYLLKVKSRKELSEIYGLASLCDRARRAASCAETLDDLVTAMKTAHLTDSRIRRSLLALLLGTPRYVEKEKPAYTMLLAASERGKTLLSERVGDFPIFAKPAHALRSKDNDILRQASRAALADEIYVSAFPKKHDSGFFVKKMPRFL